MWQKEVLDEVNEHTSGPVCAPKAVSWLPFPDLLYVRISVLEETLDFIQSSLERPGSYSFCNLQGGCTGEEGLKPSCHVN